MLDDVDEDVVVVVVVAAVPLLLSSGVEMSGWTSGEGWREGIRSRRLAFRDEDLEELLLDGTKLAGRSFQWDVMNPVWCDFARNNGGADGGGGSGLSDMAWKLQRDKGR